MARYKTKYGIGEEVEVFGIAGVVTGVTINKGGKSYEFSYLGDNGPTCCHCSEVEMNTRTRNELGFKPSRGKKNENIQEK
jgi:hypothetical protein